MKIKIHVHRCQSVSIFVIKLISCNQGKKRLAGVAVSTSEIEMNVHQLKLLAWHNKLHWL